jgi:hypothetical protein
MTSFFMSGHAHMLKFLIPAIRTFEYFRPTDASIATSSPDEQGCKDRQLGHCSHF